MLSPGRFSFQPIMLSVELAFRKHVVEEVRKVSLNWANEEPMRFASKKLSDTTVMVLPLRAPSFGQIVNGKPRRKTPLHVSHKIFFFHVPVGFESNLRGSWYSK